jgi:hypothetical protein
MLRICMVNQITLTRRQEMLTSTRIRDDRRFESECAATGPRPWALLLEPSPAATDNCTKLSLILGCCFRFGYMSPVTTSGV